MLEDWCIIGTATRGMDIAAPVALTRDDRRRHLWICGKTGVGKSTLMKSLIYDDMIRERHFALLDPLGGLAADVVDAVPVRRTNEAIYWDPGGDLDHVIAFNVLDRVPSDRRHLVASHVLDAFMAVWGNSLEDAPRLTYVLYNALRLLLDSPGSTLLGLPRLLVDDRYRARLLDRCEDDVVRAYWETEFARYDDKFRAQVISPIQARVGMLLSAPALRNIVGQPRSTISIPRLMNSGGILICNLARGKMGSVASHLLGAFIATAIAQAAEERISMAPDQRRDFTLYADEVQNFTTRSFAGVLSQARQFNLSLIVAHQYLAQLSEEVRDALVGNAGTIVIFRCGADDALLFGRELGLEAAGTLAQTSNFSAWSKLLRNGTPLDPLLVETTAPLPPANTRTNAVIAHTRSRHSRSRDAVVSRFGY